MLTTYPDQYILLYQRPSSSTYCHSARFPIQGLFSFLALLISCSCVTHIVVYILCTLLCFVRCCLDSHVLKVMFLFYLTLFFILCVLWVESSGKKSSMAAINTQNNILDISNVSNTWIVRVMFVSSVWSERICALFFSTVKKEVPGCKSALFLYV